MLNRNVQTALGNLSKSLTTQILLLARGTAGPIAGVRTGGTAIGGMPTSMARGNGNDPVTGNRYFTLGYSTLDGDDVLAGTSECEE